MKKILIVNNNMKIGGVQRALINLLKETKDKYDITLFLFDLSGEYYKYIPENIKVIGATSILRVLGISVKESKKLGIKYYFSKLFFAFLTKLVGNEISISLICKFEPKLKDFDVAISYMQSSPKRSFYGGTNEFVLNRVNARKKISFVHCDYENYGGNLDYASKMYKRFDKIAFCSKGCMNVFLKLLPQFTTKSTVVYNCMDIDEINKLSLENTIIYKDKVNILSIGRMTYEKGMDRVIKIFTRYIKEVTKNAHLYLIGDGENKNELVALVNKLKMNKYITFCGNQKNVYRFMKNASLLLLFSRHEAAPMVFGEAELLKLPILSTNTTSVQELVLDKKIGLVGETDDELYKKMKLLLENKGKMKFTNSITNKRAIKQFDNLINK